MIYKGVDIGEFGEKETALAMLYVDAAFSLEPDFRAAGLDISYAINNLPYLQREYDESGQLYRVFVPFEMEEEKSSSQIGAAKEVALMRAVLEPPEEPEYQLTPEVQKLLDLRELSGSASVRA